MQTRYWKSPVKNRQWPRSKAIHTISLKLIFFFLYSLLPSSSFRLTPFHQSNTSGRTDFTAFIAAYTDSAVHSGITSSDYFNSLFGADRHAGPACNAVAALYGWISLWCHVVSPSLHSKIVILTPLYTKMEKKRTEIFYMITEYWKSLLLIYLLIIAI